jgi:phosphatidylserine/phosphatidylglycerophosphate/cardiolipin synthase-like enzyme
VDDLWKVIADLSTALHADRIASISNAILSLKGVEDFEQCRRAFGPNADQERIDRLRAAWSSAPGTSSNEIAAAFRGAAEVASLLDYSGAIELVWTGPKTGLIPVRRTEQVILEVIDSARTEIFLVSYVFYKASSIVDALNAATRRGVTVGILLESSDEHGGAIRGDSVKTASEAVPDAAIYIWDASAKAPEGDRLSAAVHAKCVVADGNLTFITSANLTSATLERNMELGVLIRGGAVPERLHSHLNALATTKVIRKWN